MESTLKHSRSESHISDDLSRPTKVLRGGGCGMSKERAIVLDDSDDDDDSEVTLVDQNPVQNIALTKTPSRALDRNGFDCHLKHTLRLFDHEKKPPKRRSERIVITSRPTENVHVHIKPKWSDGRLNIFFERSVPLPPHLTQYSHVALSTGLDVNINFSDVASHIYTYLRGSIDDFFSIEFALYKTDTDGVLTTCNSDETWSHSIIRGSMPISNFLDGDDEVAMRVRIREYITVASYDNGDHTFAISPDSDCSLRQVRDLATAVWNDKEAESMRLFVDDLELDDNTIPLAAWGLGHMSQITCVVETKECAICADDVGHLAWPSRTTSTCVHEVHNCTGCIRNWISSRLDNNSWEKITCLEEGCKEIYQAADIQLHATTEENDRYQRLAVRAELAKDPNFHWCIGPECENGQIHDGSGGDIFSCAACGYRSCAKCERPWHQEETCEQYTARLNAVDGNEAASAAFISSNTKECPSCKTRIQKDGGCDHMTCRKCRNQFCWLCSADYKDIHRQGNTAHAPNCQYHSGNVPDPHGVPLVIPRVMPPRAMPFHQGPGARRLGAPQAPMAAWRAPMAFPAQPQPQPQPPGMPQQQPLPVFGYAQYPPPAMFIPEVPQPLQQFAIPFQDPNVNQWLAGMNNDPPVYGDVDVVLGFAGRDNQAQRQAHQQVINGARERARNAAAQAHQARIQALQHAQQAREAQHRAQQARVQDIHEQHQAQLDQLLATRRQAHERAIERVHGRRLD